MGRRGHNWRVGGTAKEMRSLDVMKLGPAGFLTGSRPGTWRWSYRDGSSAWIEITRGQDAVVLDLLRASYG